MWFPLVPPSTMPSLQLLQLTEHGQNLLASKRKALLLASGIVVAGGTAAYVHSRFSNKKADSYSHYNGIRENKENPDEVLKKNNNVKRIKQKKGGLKSLQVLAAILLSEMGKIGTRDLLALVGIVVLRAALSNRLAKVQGFLFRAAFLRRVPSFFWLISENILLCFLLSTIHSTSKYITGTLSLRFRKILTKLIHAHYFENMAYYKISHVDGRIRNPEQRIASDLPRFCSELSELVQDDLTAVTDGLLYSWRLCSYASPKYILWILAYVLGAGAAIRNFSPAFGKLMSKEQQLEGEYRQLHSRLRTHAESIAFYGGESREESHIQQKFKTLVKHMRVVLHDHWWFGMIQDFLLKYLGATVAVVLIIEPFFAGQLRPDASTLGRAEMLSNLRYHTSVVISLFQALGTLSVSSRRLNRLSGYADRIHELMLISRELSADDKKSSLQRPGSRNYLTEANYVEFSGVKVVTPTGNVLVKDLSLRVPTLFDKQGAQLLAVAFLVVSRTWISDRIASLNGTTVKHVLEQNKAAFIRLIGISVLQSGASSFIAPSLRHLTARLALGWRIRLTQNLLKNYLRNNAFYQVFHMSSKNIDADQRITHDLEKLTTDLSGLVHLENEALNWEKGTVTPDFGDLTSREQQLEGTFRFMHERLRTHAESVAFFGGGAREKAMVDSRFRELLDHSLLLLKKKWLFGILDDFVTKQLPHNVTWGLSLLYALEHKGDRALVSTQGELAHALRFLASVVSQSFLAFGDILELHRKFLELSGSINRIFELEELLDAAQSGYLSTDNLSRSQRTALSAEDVISFAEVDIITPAQKLLARQLTCDVVPGKSLLVTGPNGSGKSSVFRVLRGLWPIVSGRLYKPSHHFDEETASGGIFYVPQRPYTCLGTLRDQIIYPLSYEEAELREFKLYGQGKKPVDSASVLDARLKTILENVRLNYLLEREEGGWDANLNWEDILSLGEQQRLGMARLFFHTPKFGILDECTNATSVDVEEQLYRLAKDLGITRPALIPFHALELRLVDGEGKWELRSIKQ
ncbi:ABC transporter D family member 1-like [Gossypium australe]|uniref:ABC transporter D family member 1-like n=1 Tax=Gossypium australe TaxID=47621 RepID=A0A5B6UYX3_9ROSI|nr:ABC transporter D family member 1-like [Gossypium australe]